MKKINIIKYANTLLLFSIALFSSCSSTGNKKDRFEVYTDSSMAINDSVTPIKLDVLNAKYVDFYSLIDSINVIELETTDESLIGSIDKLIMHGDTLFVADYTKAKAILAFDLEGNYLYKINKLGEGPGEYSSINMVHIENHVITILDRISWKFIQYNLSGKLISEQRIEPCPADLFFYNDETAILCYSRYKEETPHQIVMTNSNFIPRETAFAFKNTRGITTDALSGFQRSNNGDVLFHYSNCDTIFSMKADEISAKYDLSLYEPEKVSAFLEKTKELNDREFYKKNRELDILPYYIFFELDNLLFLGVSGNKGAWSSVIRRDNYQIQNSVVWDKKSNSFKNPVAICGYHRNSLLGFLDEQFAEIRKEDYNNFCLQLKEKDIQKVKTLNDPNANPVVCIMNLRLK